MEQRTIIKFLVKSGHTPIQCWRQLHQAFGTETFSKNTVRMWHKTFSQGRDQVKDLACPGHPKSTRTDEAVQQVRDQLQADRRKTVRQMSEDTGINKTTLHTILKKDLTLSKVAPKFIPKLLTDEQKRFRAQLCRLNLDSLEENDDFISLTVSGDESWISIFETETKQSSCEWVPKGNQAARPRKALRQRSTKKAMLTAFIDERGPVLAEFTPPRKTVNANSYCDVLRCLKEHLQKQPALWAMEPQGEYRTFRLHQDNAPSHTAAISLALIGESKILIVPHPPYSPDLAVCDYFLFPRLKSELRGHRFRNIRDMKTAVLRTLRQIPEEDYRNAMRSMPLRWMKCIASGGGYFEGLHLQVDPGDFGFELHWEDPDSSEEAAD